MKLPDSYEFQEVTFACGHTLRVRYGAPKTELWIWRQFLAICSTVQMDMDMPQSFKDRLYLVTKRTGENSRNALKTLHCYKCQNDLRDEHKSLQSREEIFIS